MQFSFPLSVDGVYTFCKPDKRAQIAPLLFDSPHSGTTFPHDFNIACTKDQVLEMSDLYVDELFNVSTTHGASLLKAEFPRSYIDLNRASNDIDLVLLDGIWPKPLAKNGRARGGIGLVHRLVRDGSPLHQKTLSPKDMTSRINNYYMPYHHALNTALHMLYQQFATYTHVNCHSMPSTQGFKALPDIVIGDLNGTSCTPELTNFIHNHFKQAGLSVAINYPYKGAEIVRRYGKPLENKNTVQLEINRKLFMSETTLKKKETDFSTLQKVMEKFTQQLTLFTCQQNIKLAAD